MVEFLKQIATVKYLLMDLIEFFKFKSIFNERSHLHCFLANWSAAPECLTKLSPAYGNLK